MKQFNTTDINNKIDSGGSDDDDYDGHSLNTESVTDNMLRELHRSFNHFNAHMGSILWMMTGPKLQIAPLISSC